VDVALLGGFAVTIDGAVVPPGRWKHRSASALVKLLALSPRARLHRERVTDALWPTVEREAALARLYKAAHYARQALDVRDAIVIRDEVVALFPAHTLQVDVLGFEAAADAALRADTMDACVAALALYPGELLPDDVESWFQEPRQLLQARQQALLYRCARSAKDSVPPDPILAATAVPTRPAVAVAPMPTLLERDAELGSLARIARSLPRTGRGTVVLVTGEAGSGKSALVQEFLAHLDPETRVAVGGCDDLLAPRSLGPVHDMAETMPELATVLSSGAGPEDVFPALLRTLAAAPTVVVIEDVHWADDATLDAIRYLSRRIAAAPLLLLLTFRDEDISATHPLRRILGSLSGASTKRFELAPLSVDAVRRLAGTDPVEAAELHRITRGNAFFLTEILAAESDGVPATVRDAVLARVGRLPEAARRLAERVAVVPSRAERWLVETLAGDDRDALVHMERSGVVSGGPEHVSYRHELARRAIETSMTVGELVQANREVLDVLLRQPHPEPSRIVHHAVRALRTDVLLEYGPAAAAEAERAGAHRQAAETLRLVLAHEDRLDEVAHASLLTRRAYSLYVVNEYQAALPCARSAVSVAEASQDPVVLAEALIVLSRTAFFALGPHAARPAAARAVTILEGLGDDARLAAALIELARTHSNLATVGIVAQPDAAVVRHAALALALGERLRRDDLRAQALWYLGSGRVAQGEPAGGDDIERAIALAGAETPLEVRIRGYVNAAGSAHRAGRLQDAQRYVATGLRLAADGEFAAGEYRLLLTSAGVCASQGDWDRAIAELRRLIARPGQPGVMGLLARSVLVRLLARRGDPEAHDVLAQATSDPLWTSDSYVGGPLAVATVELAWLTACTGPIPSTVWTVLDLAASTGHTAIQAELCGYLRRAGHDITAPQDAPGPWRAALAGDRCGAAAAWRALGERYEQAVELAQATDGQASADGLAMLTDLGATATLARCLKP
jgi:tetratricopeptide (TPR) repeat protein